MKLLKEFKDNKNLYLDDYCNLHIIEETKSFLIKFLDISDCRYSSNKKFISFREIMFKIFNRNDFSKARNTSKRYEIYLNSSLKLNNYFLDFSINNDCLYICIYCRFSMEQFILVDTDISNFLISNYNEFLSPLEKYLLSLKSSKIYKESNKNIFYNKKVSEFKNLYYLNFNRNSYSLDYSIKILDYISQVMKKLNSKLIFNNKNFVSFNNSVFSVNLKREKNNNAHGYFQYYNINLNLVKKDFQSNKILIELVFIHEYAHALDRSYFNSSLKKSKFINEKREKLILDVIKNDNIILKTLVYGSYSKNLKNESEIAIENKIKMFLKTLDSLSEFYNSVYYNNLSDYRKYCLNDEEIVASLFEIYYLDSFYKVNYNEYSENVFSLLDKDSIVYLERFLKESNFFI